MMRALVWTGPGCLELQERPAPEPGEGEVLIESKAVGVCGTDLHIFEGHLSVSRPPLVLGHEAAGVVVRVGKNVRDSQPGDRVLVDPNLSCGHCYFCDRGYPHQCRYRQTIGISGKDGAFAGYVVAPVKNTYAVPDSVSWEQAGAVDPLACALHALDLIPAPTAESVAIFGAGPSGLCFLQLCRLRGVPNVVVVDLNDRRLEVARSLGAHHILNPDGVDVVQAMRGLTKDLGIDLAIEASGSPKALLDGLKVTRNKGNLLVYAVYAKPVDGFDFQDQHRREITIYGSSGSPDSYPEAIRLVGSGKINVQAFVSHRLQLEELPRFFADGIIQQQRDGYLKAVVFL